MEESGTETGDGFLETFDATASALYCDETRVLKFSLTQA